MLHTYNYTTLQLIITCPSVQLMSMYNNIIILFTVCDDHHFKDEYLFYRFKNDEKGKGLNLRDRLNSKKTSRRNRSDDDISSVGDSSDHRASGSSFDSVSVGGNHSPEQDE